MKVFATIFCALSAIIANSAFATTVNISASQFKEDVLAAGGKWEVLPSYPVIRSRFSLGSAWVDGLADLKLVFDFTYYEGNPISVGLTSSANDDFIKLVADPMIVCGGRGCYEQPNPGSVHFASNTLTDLATPSFERITSLSTLPDSASWDAATKQLTLDYTTMLTAGAPYYLFTQFEGYQGYPISYTASLSQLPIPATVWLFASGLIGVVRVCRRSSVSK
jgi:hypothetical protein